MQMSFGERWAFSVSELNEYVRRTLAGDPVLRSVEVRGEISGYKHHVSGHRYFSLKDESARVQCVMFRQQAMGLDFRPADGMRVTVRASASVFVRDGSYQLYVESMQAEGAGDLYLRFERLKKKLADEGLFDPARKREIPLFPKTIGIATSRTGAAVHDIVQIARRRNPNISIVLAPCAVQGSAAAGEIVRAIERLNRQGEADVLLVGRGGGSMEDLFAFNEESVARAIAASRIPVISCVGHEVDFTIADFVADLRAPTPSAAAEMAVPVLADLQAELDGMSARLSNGLARGQALKRARLERLLAGPAFVMPSRLLIERRQTALEHTLQRSSQAVNRQLSAAANRLAMAERTLSAVDPQKVIERGYAAVKKNGKYVTQADSLSAGDKIDIVMRGGVVRAGVTGTNKQE